MKESLILNLTQSISGPTRPNAAHEAAAATSRGTGQSADADRTWTLPGLCWNTSVMTSFGALPVQVLRKHDPLRMIDGTVARITWVDKIQLDEEFLASYPDAQPIRIRSGALGPGQPAQDILVSPQQKMTVTSTGYAPRLLAARDLLGRPDIMRLPQTTITYYLFHCGQQANVMSEGLGIHTAP